MKNIISILLAALLFTSCEKTVDLKYKSNTSKIIIEGNITNEPGPYFIKITKSVSLSATGNYPTIDNAVVTISDNAGNNETLTPQGNGLYRTSLLTGVSGRTYTLTVNAESKTFTAQSTMPQQVWFDSVKAEKTTFGGDVEYNIIPIYTDPVTKGNNYRFELTVNNKLLRKQFLQNDDVTNGVTNTERLEEIDDFDLEPKPGDSLSIKMQCIDAKVALYYKTLALIGDSGPGGGTTPNNPPNNFTNGALGIFSAHTTQTRKITLR
jgi:hypothetical protein